MAALGKQAAARRAQAQSPRQRGLGPTARLGLLINSPTRASDSQVSFNYMAAVTVCCDFGVQENKVTVSIVSSFTCHEVMGLETITLAFLMLSFKQLFHSPLSPSSTGSSSLSAISVVSSANLRLSICLPTILIPAYD